MSKLTTRNEALEYHKTGRPGKIEVVPTKPTLTQIDLSLAYSPGVAEPCREIEKDPDKVYEYTAKGNLVAVITDGTAVLGLGDIGPNASKPVMEGKGVLFKRFADIDVFDIELGTKDTEEIIAAIKAISPTVSGINLEDISAPRCFEIEQRLIQELDIPVFHDDQHGTAIISGASLLNAAEVAGKKLEDLKLVVSGAGASAMTCAKFAVTLGVKRENVLLIDRAGVIYQGRTENMSKYKEAFAVKTDARTLEDAMKGADAFFGLSVGGLVTPEMLLSMAENPIVFAMANPDPEIAYDVAKNARADVIMATGRSDFPNQVNNVLGFPFIFRGALDVRASTINEEMKLAAAHALADLAKEPVPDSIAGAYGLDSLEFGAEYIIPKPLDHRVIRKVAVAVAEAAMKTGVARAPRDLDIYVRELGERAGQERELMRELIARARHAKKRVLYPEGEADRAVIAASAVVQEGIAQPILLGKGSVIQEKANLHGVSIDGISIVDPENFSEAESYAKELFQVRQHRGRTLEEARERLKDPQWLGPMMVRMGAADCMVAGLSRHVRKTMGPMLKVIPLKEGVLRACAMTLMFTQKGLIAFADTAVNENPTAEDLAEIAILSAEKMKRFGIKPVVAMLSSSSYGGSPGVDAEKVRRAVAIAQKEAPSILIDGEMRVDCALDPMVQGRYENCKLNGQTANVLVFPDLQSANIGFNLVRSLTDAYVVGPIMLGLQKPVHMLQPHSIGVSDIVHLTAVACGGK